MKHKTKQHNVLALCVTLAVPVITQFTYARELNQPSYRRGVATGIYDNAQGSPIVDLIDQAQHSLDMEFYEMDDPRVLQSLRNALGRGVAVHVVKEAKPVGGRCNVFDSGPSGGGQPGDDPDYDFSTFSLFDRSDEIDTLPMNSLSLSTWALTFHSFYSNPFSASVDRAAAKSGGASCEEQQQLVREVNRSGGRYVPFTKPELCGGNGTKSCLQHGKIAISDAKVALISSGNFNTTNLCNLEYSPGNCNRDYSYVTDDRDIITTLRNVVERDIVGEKYDVESAFTERAYEKVTVGPNSLSPLVDFIGKARSEVLIQNQYLKDPTMNAAIVAAARRGVQVHVMVASACHFSRPRPTEVKRLTAIFREFEDAGVSIQMFNKRMQINGLNGYLHAKAIVIDGQEAWMGSVNGSTQAVSLNREFGAFFRDQANVNKLRQIMLKDMNHPQTSTWQESLNCDEKFLMN